MHNDNIMLALNANKTLLLFLHFISTMGNNINFGLIINQLIEERNITKVRAAEMMGYSRKGFSDALDKEDVSTSLLKKVCEVFEVDMSYFLLTNNNNISQKGNANIAGTGSVQYKGQNNVMGSDSKIQILESENEHLKKQIQLLEQMVSILKSQIT